MIARVARSTERHKHPATRVFQALRIYVNGELEELETALDAALKRLAPRGRLAVISFHSLEDRMVKQFMRRHSLADPMYAGLPNIPAHAQPKLRLVGKAVDADENEISRNPRARSAHLRVAERLVKESPHETPPLAAAHSAAAVVGRIGSAGQVIYERYKARDMFVRLESLNVERDSLDMEWGRLQLEQSYWSSHAFVERVANAKLQMNIPQMRDVRIVRP